jgi:hypothetical protein
VTLLQPADIVERRIGSSFDTTMIAIDGLYWLILVSLKAFAFCSVANSSTSCPDCP